MNCRTSESRVKTVIFDTNLQLLVLQKPRRTLLPSNPRSRNFEPPGIRCEKCFARRNWSCNNPWRSFGNFKPTKDRKEHKSVQAPSAAQELQLAKMARDLRKELEMDQLRGSIRKRTEDYKSLQGPGATRELRQAEIDHGSSGKELKQIKSILEKLTRDHEQLREAVQGTSPRPNGKANRAVS